MLKEKYIGEPWDAVFTWPGHILDLIKQSNDDNLENLTLSLKINPDTDEDDEYLQIFWKDENGEIITDRTKGRLEYNSPTNAIRVLITPNDYEKIVANTYTLGFGAKVTGFSNLVELKVEKSSETVTIVNDKLRQ